MKKLTLGLVVFIMLAIYFLGIKDIGVYAGNNNFTQNQEIYRYITAIFAHADINHLFSNIIFFVAFGKEVIKKINSFIFLLIFLISGILANIVSVYYYTILSPHKIIYTLGASGAASAILGAFIINAFYEEKIYRKKSIGTAALILPILLILGNDINVNYISHISGFISGAIIMQIVLMVRYRKENYV